MRNINKVILVGNISYEPQMKETAGGQPVTTFGVATHRAFTTKAGEDKSITEFHNVVAWGGLARRCMEDLRKGKLVYIEGYLKTRSFDLEGGKKSFRTEVVAYNMIILSKRDQNGNAVAELDMEKPLTTDENLSIAEALDDNTF